MSEPIRPIFTVRHPALSRWQSSVEHYLRRENPGATTGEIRSNPMIQGNWKHVEAAVAGGRVALPPGDNFDVESIAHHTYASQFFYELAENLRAGLENPSEVILATASDSVDTWPYSTADTAGWVAAAAIHYEMKFNFSKTPQYRDYEAEGESIDTYSVIDWTFPEDATAIVVGDWGTDNDDAIELMRQLIADNDPDFIIHLGDIYYAGTPDFAGFPGECSRNFYDILRTEIGTKVPVFTIPGNHEYYALGYGYFDLIDQLNENITVNNATQDASYFCLRMEGSNSPWQFVGLDTGYNDASPYDTYEDAPAPALKSKNDVKWAANKIKHFSGNTIMLSHHQLYSHTATMSSDEYGTNCANPHLYRDFAPFFGSKIAAWFWGHEHSYAAYKKGIFGLSMGRLVGCSSYEQAISDDSYADTWPLVPFDPDSINYQLLPNSSTAADANDYYPHVGAVINFNGSANPAISYFRLPSYENGNKPSNATLTTIATESIEPPRKYASGFWIGNHKLKDDDFRTNKAPGLAMDGDNLYIVYRNTSNSNNLWWDSLDVNTDKGKFSGKPQALTPSSGSSVPDTQSNPAVAVLNGKLHVLYTDNNKLCWSYLTISSGEWVKNGSLSNFSSGSSSSFNTNHGPSLVHFGGNLYVFFLNSDDKTVNWAVYDPSASESSSWTYGSSISVGGSTLKSGNEIVPVVAANSSNIYLAYGMNDGSNQIGITYTGDISSWYDLGVVGNDGLTDNLPETTSGFALCTDSNFLRLVYRIHNSDHEIGWAIRDLNENVWSGGLPIVCQNGTVPATQGLPGMCMGSEYTYMSYPGNSSKSIWSAIQSNYPR